MDDFVYNCMLAEKSDDDKIRENLEWAIKTVNAGKGSWSVDLAGTYYKIITGVNTAVAYWLRYKYETNSILEKWEDWDKVRS